MQQPRTNGPTHWRVTIWMGIVFVLAACAGQSPVAPSTVAPTAALPLTNVPPTSAPTQTPPVAAAQPPATAQGSALTTAAQIVIPPPDCSAGVTPVQTEGPYYKADTPERASLLEPGMAGAKIIVTGYVLTRECKPIAGAWLDFWQANDQGVYDNSGYTLRGHQFTDANGRYTLETILPGLYPGRTRHIHVKVQAPDQPTLTAQLYFPEEAQRNSADGIYDPKLLVTWLDTSGGKIALYNFVLNVK